MNAIDFINQNFTPQEKAAYAAGLDAQDRKALLNNDLSTLSPNAFAVLHDKMQQMQPSAPTNSQKIGANHPAIAHILADLAQGGTNFANSLKHMVGAAPDKTNYYDEYGVQPNLADDLASGAISTAPYAVSPEALIDNSALGAPSLGAALARFGVRGATGAVSNHELAAGEGQPDNGANDALSALIYGGTGALGDILPSKLASLATDAQTHKLPDEAIEEGQRMSAFPDVGNQVGAPSLAEKWKETLSAPLSKAKPVQEDSNSSALKNSYGSLQDADQKALSIYDALKGDAQHGQLPLSIAQDMQDTHAANRKEGNALYAAIQPSIEKATMNTFPNVQDAANSILQDAENANAFGVTDKDLKNDVVARAQNASEMGDAGQYPVDQAIKEERNLSSIASELKGRGHNAAARYYDMLANGYQSDINNALPDDVKAGLDTARNYWKNNVIPFTSSTVGNKIINNNFDEDLSPLTLSKSLTNGSHNQLVKILPQATKNKIAANLLFNKAFDGLGNSEHPSIALNSSLSTVPMERLNNLLQGDSIKDAIASAAKQGADNKAVLSKIEQPTQTVGNQGLSLSANPHSGFWSHIGNISHMPTSNYWTNVLTDNKGALSDLVKSPDRITIGDTRTLGKAGASIDPRDMISSILRSPNSTRIPLSTVLQALEGDNSNGN